MQKKKIDIREIFVDLQRVSEYYANYHNFAVLGEEKNIYEERMQLHFIAQELIRHNFKDPFGKKGSNRNSYIKNTDLSDAIIKFLELFELSKIAMENKKIFDYKIHCPQVEIMFKIADVALSVDGGEINGVGFVPALPFRPDEYKFLDGADVDIAIKALNEFALILREALLSRDLRERVKSFRRNATERYKNVMRAAEQAWEKNCKNLLIRLDWSFRKTYPAMRTRFKSQKDFEDQLMEVDGYRKQMLHILRDKFGKNLAFYAWKIECGDIKGIHIHWLIAVNGSKHQDRINVGRQISSEWDMSIGVGKSYTFNVNGQNGAEISGLKVIQHNDPELWNILGRYCDYLTKVDYTLKLRMPKKMRSFGCSKITGSTQKKTGPKRKFPTTYKNIFDVRGRQGGSQIN